MDFGPPPPPLGEDDALGRPEALVDKVVDEFLLDERLVVGRQLATEPIYNIHRGVGGFLRMMELEWLIDFIL